MQKSRAIASARAFLENSAFDIVVDISNLNPKEDWHLWEDPEGNQLSITKNHRVIVTPSEIRATKTRDLFRQAPPVLIAKYSYWVLALFGEDKTILNFLGNDGLLRVCFFMGKKWEMNIAPLIIGYPMLNVIATSYLDIEPQDIIVPRTMFEIEEAWASGYPSTDSILQERIQCHLTNQDLPE